MKGDLTLAILEILQGGTMAAVSILDALTYHGYGESYRHMRGLPSRIPERKPPFQKTVEKMRDRQKTSKLLYNLKTEGLIAETQNGEKRMLKLTRKGRLKVKSLKEERVNKTKYKPGGFDELKIVIFDIPETERLKRHWLRSVLKRLEFKMVQKSVWVGTSSLPTVFFEELRQKNLIPFIEIFAVSKTGSLKRVLNS